MLRRSIPAALAVMSVLPGLARGIDFSFIYTDPSGQGFFDPALGGQRRAALEYAATLIGHTIRPTYLGESVTVQVSSYNNPGTISLATAKPAFFYANFGSADLRYQTDTYFPKALASSMIGHDIQPGHLDIIMTVNLANSFYWGTDGVVPAGQYDFASVAMHELTHGLGFSDSFRQQGGYGVFGDGTNDTQTGVSGFPEIYDRFVSNGGTPVISISDSAQRAAALVNGNITWSGGAGNLGNGGTTPRLFAPSPFQTDLSIAHLNDPTYPSDPMISTIGTAQVRQAPSAIDRGILYDMGWNIGIFASNITWTAGGGNNLSSNNNNWSQMPMPGDSLTFSTNAASVYDVKMDAQLYQYGEIHFTAAAPAYTLRLRSYTDTDLTAFGIRNDSSNAHTFILETYADDLANNTTVQAYFGRAATLNFRNTASASNSIFQIHGGVTDLAQIPNSPPSYTRYNGAAMTFYNSSTAASGTFTVQGATGDGAPSTIGSLGFRGTSNAGSANITNLPGITGVAIDQNNNITSAAGFGAQTSFFNSASAAFAHITNKGEDEGPAATGTGGITNFYDTSTAAGATLDNLGATYTGGTGGFGGTTQFQNNSSAGSAHITNHESPVVGNTGGGITSFYDTATAGSAIIENLPDTGQAHSAGSTVFRSHSTAGTATINNRGATVGYYPGATQFNDDSSAGNASIHCFPCTNGNFSIVDFYDRSTGGSASIIMDNNPSLINQTEGYVHFHNTSSLGYAALTVLGPHAYGQTQFHDQSNGGSGHINMQQVDDYRILFLDSSSAANCTINGNANSYVQFYGNSNAGSANITAQFISFAGNNTPGNPPTTSASNSFFHVLATTGTSSGGFMNFQAWSTAANSSIVVDGATSADAAASLYFSSLSSAGHATITLMPPTGAGTSGGQLTFTNGVTADSAHIIAGAGSLVFTANSTAISIGSLEGAGAFNMNTAQVSLGGLGLDAVISGTITGLPNCSLTKIGPASLTLTGLDAYQGPTTVSAGTLAFNPAQNFTSSLTISAGATARLTGSGGGFKTPVSIAGTTNAWTGKLDLTANPLIVQTTSAADKSAKIATLDNQIISGSNGSTWTGNGITSSTAAADRQHYGVGLFDNAILQKTSFGGKTTDTNSIFIALAHLGDTNADGIVNIQDISIIANNWQKNRNTWTQGDLNLNGIVNIQDFSIVANNWQQSSIYSLAPDSGLTLINGGQPPSSVPEPAIFPLFALAGMLLVRPRRRRT